MKKVLTLIVLLAGIYFAYNYFSKSQLSSEEKQVTALADEFASAKQRLNQAGRAAGLSGVDTTSSAEEAMTFVNRVKENLQTLKEKLTDEKAIKLAEKLEAEIDSFLQNQSN